MSSDSARRIPWVLAVAFVSGLILVSPVGRWLLGTLWPLSQTRNAYLAFGQLEWTSAAAKPLDAIARAELALTDENLAVLLADRPRVHPPGTLATLEYTTIGANGEALDLWRVRAIVPMLGAGGDLDARAWHADVGDIASRLRREGGMVLGSSGDAGLPAEAVLRLRVGETVEMTPSDAFATTDFMSGKRHHVRKRTFSLAGGPVTVPTRLRVKLVAACPADVRVGENVQVEYAAFAPIPIPTGFRVQHWVQMTGCTPVAADGESKLPPAEPAVVSGGDATILQIERDGAVRVAEASLQAEDRPLRYRIDTVCRFDADEDRWQVLLQSHRREAPLELAPLLRSAGASEPRVVARVPPVALYWFRWSEGFDGSDAAALRSHHAFGYAGGMLCDGVQLGTPPAGMVAVCVPFADRAEARFVPDPVQACAARDGP